MLAIDSVRAVLSTRAARAATSSSKRARVGTLELVYGTVRTQDVAGDGNCYFRALAHQLNGGRVASSDVGFDNLRLQVAAYAANHPELESTFLPFFDLAADPDWTWQSVVDHVQLNSAWRNQSSDIVLGRLAASFLGRIVHILQEATPPQTFEPIDSDSAQTAHVLPPLVLFRIGEGQVGGHFRSVIRDE